MRATRVTSRTAVGVVATIIWTAIVGWLLLEKADSIPSLTLEQWGAFLGGITGPVAFLWLVLGYVQQGEELRLNTEALRLQQQELQHQVAETAALVKHTESQARAAIDALEIERKRYSDATRAQHTHAQLLLQHTGGVHTGSGGELVFVNAGGRARSIVATIAPSGGVSMNPADVLQAGGSGRISYNGVTEFPLVISLRYTDDFGDVMEIVLDLKGGGAFKQRDNFRKVGSAGSPDMW